MSKDKPEVGDVWTDNKLNFLICVTGITEFIHFLWGSKEDVSQGYFHIGMYATDDVNKFKEYYTYLGKSKASIEQLFEVENEDAR